MQPKPLLVFDGDCGFCRAWIARWRRRTGDRLDVAPYQRVAPDFPDIPVERFQRAVHLIEPDGRRSQGAEAVFRSLALAPGGGAWSWCYANVPGFAPASEVVYRFVADRRGLFTWLTNVIWGPHVVPPGEARTTWIFLRLLAVVYAIAFASLGVQIVGLAGEHGVLSAREYLQAVPARFGLVRLWFLPTLYWLHMSDGFLVGLCVAGTALAVLLLLGLAPILCLAGLWLGYLSVTTAGQEFMWFQWDILLLEAGFLALFVAPRRWWSRPGSDPPPPQVARWLLRWLLFRLMFSSAAVKLSSGDPTWRDLTALTFHYETQPLPPWTAWYAHHLPLWAHKVETLGMFAIEGVAPFGLFGPRRIRFAATAAIALLQLLIMATGNYGFFNWLTLALCALSLDDAAWPWRWKRIEVVSPPAQRPSGAGRWPLRVAAAFLVALSLVPLAGAVHVPLQWLGPLTSAYRLASPLHVVNGYGLFAVMTTRRMEIVVEGSDDLEHWRAYEFRYKPGDLARRPRFVAPHQPRLDWQMWFAALGDYRASPWFFEFCKRLLEGARPVRALLANDPFPDRPPRYIRATVYQYHFTDSAERRSTGNWWRREERGLFCPILTLEDGQLRAVGG